MTRQILSYQNFTVDPFQDFSPTDDTKGAFTILRWAYDLYGDSIVYACSFGAESMVLIDLLSKVKSNAKIVFLDTGLHFQETYDLIDEVKNRYPDLRIDLKQPDLTVDEQAAKYGSALWKRKPDQCCFIRKIKPLEEVLDNVPAWISGLRREQSLSRSKTDFVNKDERFKSIKVCPLIHWTWGDVWNYILQRELPYNELHDNNFPSIGCIPCTSQVTESDDLRAGRWTGQTKTECGLHTNNDDRNLR
ncbi:MULTISPECIES: phosphoadenylyl-sulfate reductase [Virgibacillus]|uniref:Adenosine 5'-phosphosulfate reductase n=1 Tax=Virgibacillus dokdonensis TaxID=302167 RepID=A0A2K9IYR1_9BACI|nr:MULTISPECIES: phosphoadenylyl-sulfate reductase [Virgibacillus]AUJ24595.1 Phosphoadenosine phosphosulfate reductase [Virgibacillus dokdonensis]NWO13077.1 phosphoadenylyl-sulfate reductase [Virgibacillus sp.]